ncbi:putative transposase [Angulomicrobium tetraedrale]|uniref:Putative transposase n=1 Tax=Ancylobacter tetraedralis TaxID=217068 RepID=A0A839Z3C1_9HYPH|nr:transposase [Ancylobacter tetraedralis]MBB3771204.1 putative transposase [Ancylobacter tetraedralis]
MRRSQFTDNEIIQLIREADAGVPVDEICRTARVSLRTFYRWRRRFGSLSEPAVLQMKELEAENRRLRSLVSNLSERLHAPAGEAPHRPEHPTAGAAASLPPGRASLLAAERCGGAVVGRFASVRITR